LKLLHKKTILYLLLLIAGFCCGLSGGRSNFVMWQLPSQINTIGNSYIFLMNDGKVVVMDGGVKEETTYLRGFLAALGNEVAVWFVSHPHPDHIGALNEILKSPGGIKIETICLSEYSSSFCEREPDYVQTAKEFYLNLNRSGIPVINILKPGRIINVDQTKFKILSVKNEDITVNPYNNSSMAIKVWDEKKSILFLGDMGKEGGDRLLNGPYRNDLDCDYIQMAHHGQKGVSKDFYRSVKFKVCLWPSPSWVFNNDNGGGYNTANYETVEIRNLIDSLGIKDNYVSYKGLYKIE